jgi:hypothetical protein
VPTPKRSDVSEVLRDDKPTGAAMRARDLRKREIRPWAHERWPLCARFPRSAVKIGVPRYYELRKPGTALAEQRQDALAIGIEAPSRRRRNAHVPSSHINFYRLFSPPCS